LDIIALLKEKLPPTFLAGGIGLMIHLHFHLVGLAW